jgi:hypothetical protein
LAKATGIKMEVDWTGFLDVIQGLRPPELDRPVALALADTAKAANIRAARVIAKWIALRVGDVKPKLSYDSIPVGRYYTYLKASRKHWRLADFSPVQTPNGVRAAKPWGKAQVFRGTFIAYVGGRKGVFRRVGKSRLPIKEQFGPTPLSTFKHPPVAAVIKAAIKERLPVLLARRINSELHRRGKGKR